LITWTVRRASLHDQPALEDLCRAAVGEDDYVLPILRQLILRYVTYVALDADRAVGMMIYHEVLDGSAWLSAARTHPDFRRKGIAMGLVQALEGLARMKGLHAVRLWTSASNAAGVASFTKAGFREVARFTRMCAKASNLARKVPLRPLRFDEDLWARLESSEILRKANRFVSIDYEFLPITRATAHALVNRGVLLGWRGNGLLVSEAFAEGETAIDLELLFGPLDDFLRAAPGIAKGRGGTHVETFLPHDPSILSAARAAGFEPMSWGQEAILCEKPLDVARVVPRTRKTYAEMAAAKRTGYAARSLLAPSGHGHGSMGPHEDRWNP